MRAIFLLTLLSGCACFHAEPTPTTVTYSAPAPPPPPPVTHRKGG